MRTLTLLDEAGNTHIPSSINLYNTNTKLDQGDGYALRVNTYYGYMDVGPQNTSYAHFSTDIPKFHFNKPVYVQGDIYAGPYYSQKVWHQGNDGAGSGLDADLLDGYQGKYYLRWSREVFDANDIEKLGSPYIKEANNGSNMPTSNGWHQVFNWGTGDGAYGFQMANTYTTNGNIYYRHKIAGTWYDWRIILDSGNYASMLDTRYVKKTGDTMTGTLRSSTIRSTLGSRDAYMNKCLCSYKINSASIQGIIKITLPFTWSFSMNVYRIVVYEYDQYAGSEILVSGYDYKDDKHFYQYGYSILGAYNKGVRLADDGSKICILLGTTSTVWRYPAVFLDTVYASYSGAIDNDWSTPNYNITLITSETGLSSITNLSDKMQDRYDSRYVNVSGDTMSGSLTVNAKIFTKAIELSDVGGPYIDFHFNNSSADYTSRIEESASGRLAIRGKLAVGATSVSDSYALSATSFYSSGNLTVNGLSTFSGTVTANGINCTSVNASAWYYSTGATGWYNSTYAGGIYMKDASYIRVYNNKSFVSPGCINSPAGFCVNQTNGAGIGISLYGSEITSINNPQFGLMFAQTHSYGTYGTVTGNWATYFTMSADTDRGWIFRMSNGTYAASISNYGDIYAKRNMVAYGEVTAYSTSDIRLKKNIIDITTDEAINILSKIRPVTYEWNNKAFELNSHQRYKGRETGLIAQEVISILPCAIKTVFDEYMSIDYTRLIPPIIAVVNKHELEIQRLKEEIKRLKERLVA